MKTILTTSSSNNIEAGEYLDTKYKDGKIFGYLNDSLMLEINVDKTYEKYFYKRNPVLVVRDREKTKDKYQYKLQLLRFVHLHVHSEFSLLDGLSKVEEIAEKYAYTGAITDHGNMFGFVKFHKEMTKRGKKPIFGFEGYLENTKGENKNNHILILAKNAKGYRNLIKLTSLAYFNFYNKPHLTFDMLEKHKDGLIVTSACLGGEIQRFLANNQYDEAKELALKFKGIFKDDFYLEIQRHYIGMEEEVVNEGLIRLSKDTGIKLVATADSHYLNKEDNELHEILLAMQTKKTIYCDDRMTFDGTDYHILTADEMDLKFNDIPEALDNTLEIAKKCDFELSLGELKMPLFDVPDGHTEDSYLEKLSFDNLNKKIKKGMIDGSRRKEYEERAKHELKIIENMGYSGYFLIVQDFIRYAKDNGIIVGPGRGSAVGSLVSYLLDIISVDPIPHNLLFERFLNPERVSMPDIDIDFCFERREEVVDYIKKKYGKNSVSRIVTFQTMAGRAAIRAVGRALDIPLSEIDPIAKAFPAGSKFKDVFSKEPKQEAQEFLNIYNENPTAKKVIDIARRLEGLPENTSTHACGLVIAPSRVDDFLPEALLGKEGEKQLSSQVVMGEVEDLGLLKMDLLGLKTLTVIDKTINSINKEENLDLNYGKIDILDPYVYKFIGYGDGAGLFQIAKPGMQVFMKELFANVPQEIAKIEKKYNITGYRNPKTNKNSGSLEDYLKEMRKLGFELHSFLIAGISLYRPGPLDNIPSYLEYMNNPEKIEYQHPKLEPILKETFGIIVYQEQVMKIVQELAGFTTGQADIVRRAMGKKIEGAMDEQKNKFIYGEKDKDGNVVIPGAVNNGVDEKIAEEIWSNMEDFNKYAFNKSHSAGYADIAARTAWLKLYYPVNFMTELLNVYLSNRDMTTSYLYSCQVMGIDVKTPDINLSAEDFTKDGENSIRFGLRGIKNLKSAAKEIIVEREENGKFKNLTDFVDRMLIRDKMNKTILESLAYSGALESFGYSRRAIVVNSIDILNQARKLSKFTNSNQINMFNMTNQKDVLKIEVENEEEFSKKTKLAYEYDINNFYISEHPLDSFEKYLKQEDDLIFTDSMRGELVENEETGEMIRLEAETTDNSNVKVAGIIKDVRTYYGKQSGKPLKVFTLEDKKGTIEVVMFHNKLSIFGHLIQEQSVVLLQGRFQISDMGNQIIADSILDLEEFFKSENIRKNAILIRTQSKNKIKDLNKILTDNKDNVEAYDVYIKYKNMKLKSDKKLICNTANIEKINKWFGQNNVKYA